MLMYVPCRLFFNNYHLIILVLIIKITVSALQMSRDIGWYPNVTNRKLNGPNYAVTVLTVSLKRCSAVTEPLTFVHNISPLCTVNHDKLESCHTRQI